MLSYGFAIVNKVIFRFTFSKFGLFFVLFFCIFVLKVVDLTISLSLVCV